MGIRDIVGGMADRVANAMAADRRDTGPIPGTLGGTGTNIFAGVITEEYKTQLIGGGKWDVYERMLSDAQVTAVSEVVNLPARAAEWFVAPAKDATNSKGDPSSSDRATMIAEFIQESLWTMPHTDWNRFVGEAIEGHQTGVSLFEISWARRGGRIVWDEFGTRLPRTVQEWMADDGRFAGIHQRIYSDHDVDATIPAEKLIRITFGQKGSNWEGRGWLRTAYKHWWFVELFEKIFAIAAERTGGGIPVINMPEGGNTSENRTAAKNLLKAWRVGNEVGPVLPFGFDLEITDIKLPATLLLAIDHHNAMMARAALAGFLNLGKRGEGSYALSKSGQDLFLMSLEAGVELIRDSVQKQAIRQLVHWNFGSETPMPELRYRINRADAIEQIEALERASRARVIVPDDNIEEILREGLDFPPIDYSANRRESITVQPPSDDPDGASETRHWPRSSVYRALSPSYDDRTGEDPSEPHLASGRGRIGDPHLAAEFTHDPTRDGSGFWRAITDRERKLGFANINKGWDQFVEALRTTIGVETDQAVGRLLSKLRRAMDAANLDDLMTANFEATFTTALRNAYREIGVEAVTWASKSIADGVGIPGIDMTAKEYAWLRATWDQQLARWRQNVREEVVRKIRRDPALRAEMAAGKVGSTTINRVLGDARANYEAVKQSQLVATAKVAVGEGIHVGFNTILRSDDVTLVQRSELLDANTCSNCRTLDGNVFTKDQWASVAPPTSCLGGSLCRGVGIPILATESPQPKTTSIESLPSLEPTRMSEV